MRADAQLLHAGRVTKLAPLDGLVEQLAKRAEEVADSLRWV